MPNSLEQQAMERVAQMYGSFERRPSQHRPPHTEQKPEPTPPEPEQPPVEEKPASGFLGELLRDQEQSLILLLLVILLKDGADLNLILALLYLVI